MRDGGGETHFECRFDNGEKFAAIIVDEVLPDYITHQIHMILNDIANANWEALRP